jgi:uncharacterized membrane protein required for colicin V production
MRMEEALFVVVGVAAIVAFLVSFASARRSAAEIHVHMEPQETSSGSGCAGLFVVLLFIVFALALIQG